MKPHSPAAERNRIPILHVLQAELGKPGTVLEIGAGTGQHAIFFAEHLPHIQWIVSDREGNHPGIREWMGESIATNLSGPLILDVQASWPVLEVDDVYSANTAHIMSWPMVQSMFRGVGKLLPVGGRFLLYGPFHYDGVATSQSNADFDQNLRAQDPAMGIRDMVDLKALGKETGLHLRDDISMPANNRMLVWSKR